MTGADGLVFGEEQRDEPRPDEKEALCAFFEAVFTASEGADEGRTIGRFVARMLGGTPAPNLQIFTARRGADLVGAALFSRLIYAQDPRQVMILSPMAVATAHQGRGAGQALIRHALDALRAGGTDVAITYGDPAFYGKLGFAPLTKAEAAPPLPLSHPQGWIGQSLSGQPFTPLRGPCGCVPALRDPALW